MDTRTAIVGLAALAGGLVLAITLAPRLYTSADPTTAEGGSGDELLELARAQSRTADALERLEALLARRLEAPGPIASERQPVSGHVPPESIEQLILTLDSLRATLERESQITQGLIRGAPAFGGESLMDVREQRSEPDWDALAGLERAWRSDARAADRSQYFQTARDLLKLYGPPTAIYRPPNGMLFFYRRTPDGVPGPQWYFRIQDGIVVEFFMEYEEVEEESD